MLENLIIPGPGDGFRGDLASLNIQRGRDHGLPGYIQFSTACGGPSATGNDFNGLTDIPFTQRVRLQTCYRTVEDIDVFTGILSERILEGSAMGRTATCLFLAQFNNTRRGDRFWYENDELCTGFPIEQLEEIRNCNLARVICDNSDGVFTIQPKVFQRRINNSPNNDVSCSSLPYVDLNVFKESKYFLLFSICILDILRLRWKKMFFFSFNILKKFPQITPGSRHSIKLVLKVNIAKFAPSYET